MTLFFFFFKPHKDAAFSGTPLISKSHSQVLETEGSSWEAGIPETQDKRQIINHLLVQNFAKDAAALF